MKSDGHAALGKGSVNLVAGIHECRYAGDVRSVGQRLQVIHQLCMFIPGLRHADRRLRRRQVGCSFADGLEAALDLANLIEILVEPRTVARTDQSAETS